MKFPLLKRILATAAVALAILLPISMIKGKVSERQARADAVVAQFAAETSGAQVIAGPFLALSCEETVMEERQVLHAGKADTVREPATRPCSTAYFTPRAFEATATAPVESLHRGLYAIRLYHADVAMRGEFDWPDAPSLEGAIGREWKEAYLVTYVQDPRGIKALTSATPTAKAPASGMPAVEHFAIREPLGPWSQRKPGSVLPFAYRMALTGTSSLGIAPVGNANDIRLSSDWPHPSFGTSWSPDERRVGAAGFEARWRMTGEATGGESGWRQRLARQPLAVPDAGVTLYDPVNIYLLSYRATEYAFLFVLFTFTALALAETLAGIRMHAMQYALVGCALAVFFLLLIALSEHFAFAHSYAAAAASCVALLTFYLRHPLGTFPRTALFFALFVALYGSLFELLRSEDNALLMGSLLTFVVLAAAMAATRKVDWGAFSLSRREPA
ncbi:MAG TPA: cell envelope integrity protein CreD, partial [Usitatibacter sp.]|jgi:inner membrane protein|nr:cell envelope integrity protein CreD [Usitatibacter sp.]